MTDKHEKQREELIKLATSQQREAANPNMSVWVEASAGTGKTKVLSDRVLRLLLSKVPPSKILCLTYTKAAAVEMSERIAKRLSLWAIETDERLKKELMVLLGDEFEQANQNQLMNFARTLFAFLLDTPGGMKIQTIHSFCQDILARFPLEAGISPYFDVLDDRNAKEILQNLKVDLLKGSYNSEDENLHQSVSYLINQVSEYSFPKIMNMITANRNKIGRLLAKYQNDITQIISVLEKNLGISGNLSEEQLKQEFMANIDKEKFKKALQTLLQGSLGDVKRADIFNEISENNFSEKYYDIYHTVFFTTSNTIKTPSYLATQKATKLWPDILCFMYGEAERFQKTDNDITALNVLKSTVSMLHIAKNIIEKYDNYKRLYAVLDFEDLIVITRRLLEDSMVADWVLFKLDGGIDHILIDEAQDTSPDQWAIVRALTQEFFAGIGRHEAETNRSVFVVGDRKQSIYSFQGADPKEFDRMYHYFSERIQNFSKIYLDVSFRSTQAIMDCVNQLFEVPQAKKGVLPSDEHINHKPYRLGDGGRVDVFPLLTDNEKKNEEKYNWIVPVVREQKSSLSNVLARQIAQNIKTMVTNREILASQNRPIRYGDFMFLVQQRNAFVEEFIRACKDIGVQVAGIDKLKLLEQIAVQDLISLGKFLLLPTDDLSLAEVLKSPLFGLDDDDLFKLCYQRNGSLFHNLLKNKNYSSVAESLKTLLNMSGFARPFELFNFVLINMNGRKNFIARMGYEVEDILDEFINLTLVFEQKHTPSLQYFISWIVQDEVVIKKEMEQGDTDTVKIMTVHGSKGLQAPIVILADTTHIKSKALKSEFLWTDDAVYYPTCSSNFDNLCKEIKARNIEADFDEYRRLLYVALTRAEDRLYIAGFVKTKDASEESWYKLLSDYLPVNVSDDKENKNSYVVEQENSFDEPFQESKPEISLPDFSDILTPAPIENPLAKPFAPSRSDNDEQDIVASPLEDNGKFYKRGTAIHKLLQYITNIKKEQRFEASLQFLKSQLPDFSDIAHQQIAQEVSNLCENYADIFNDNSMAEVPIIGEVEGKIVSAKIDRLVIEDNKVIIVDYKTNRPAAHTLEEVPALYINQLTIYRKLVEKIYPSKKVETYILWTNTCNMMKL